MNQIKFLTCHSVLKYMYYPTFKRAYQKIIYISCTTLNNNEAYLEKLNWLRKLTININTLTELHVHASV